MKCSWQRKLEGMGCRKVRITTNPIYSALLYLLMSIHFCSIYLILQSAFSFPSFITLSLSLSCTLADYSFGFYCVFIYPISIVRYDPHYLSRLPTFPNSSNIKCVHGFLSASTFYHSIYLPSLFLLSLSLISPFLVARFFTRCSSKAK